MNVHPRSVRLAALFVVALVVAALLAGCTTTTPTASPAATPEPSIPDLRISAAGVPAGRYRLMGFEPSITVGLDGSWQSLAQQYGYASVTQVSRPADPSTPHSAGTLIQITAVESVTAGADSWIKPTTAEEAVDAIRQGLGSMVIESSKSRIGGRDGQQITVERPGEGPPMSMDAVGVLGIGAGSIVLFPGDRLWIAFFETPQGVVAIVVNSSIKDWDAELAAAEPVLEQIRFEVP